MSRDGSAVEIVGLSWAAVSGLARLGPAVYRHQEVPVFGSLAAWADTIKRNFERQFWVGGAAGAEVEPRPDYVNTTSIYKDSVGSGHGWTDYQLRPNQVTPGLLLRPSTTLTLTLLQVITLAVAGDITEPRHAWAALHTVVTRLLGPLGEWGT